MSKSENTSLIKKEAARLGFMYCGISEATFLEEEAPHLEDWLNKKMNGKMGYMENYFDQRLDPRLLLPGAKSVISLLLNYYTEEKQTDSEAPKISKYAFGTDYHFVIKEKLKKLEQFICDNIGAVASRGFVDSAPVLDRAWAKRSGLGWIGKNTNLINKATGSFFFIAELIVDLELDYDGPVKDYCGTCTRCIDACPTDAIVDNYIVDGSKCISYFTIELKDELIPKEVGGKFDNWAFGCDICQDVCPWNSFAIAHKEEKFKPADQFLDLSKKDWEDLTEETFNALFKNSPLKRTKFSGLRRNIAFIKNTT